MTQETESKGAERIAERLAETVRGLGVRPTAPEPTLGIAATTHNAISGVVAAYGHIVAGFISAIEAARRRAERAEIALASTNDALEKAHANGRAWEETMEEFVVEVRCRMRRDGAMETAAWLETLESKPRPKAPK